MSDTTRFVKDVATGQVLEVPLTDVEVSERAAQAAADAAESAATVAAGANASTIGAQVDAALATNRTIITGADTYLATASPTGAQVAAQVRALTQAAKAAAQQRNGLIRLVLRKLEGTD